MENSKWPSLGAVTLILFAGAYRTGGEAVRPDPAPSTEKQLTTNRPAGESLDRNDGPWKALCLHYGVPPGEKTADSWAPCVEAASKDKILTLLATVPDPDEGHLALYFDRWVESIERAVSDTGFAFDRYWMPWKTEPAGSASQGVRDSRIQPGLILFRRAHPQDKSRVYDPDLLAVFLIGETPTSGVNIEQFRSAIAAAHRLCGDCPARVLGPSFSGSFDSLGRVLRERSLEARVVSGSSTNGAAAFEFSKNTGCGCYESTLHSDSYAIRAFMSHVKKMWQFPGVIAVITEDGTNYGAEFAREWIPDDAEGRKNVRVLSIRFPREISRLRNAEEMAEASVKVPKALALPQEFKPFDMRTDRPRLEAIPDFAKHQTPISQETALASIAAALRREKIKVAAVLATDVLDTLFVTRFLRIAAPDTRIVIFDTDILFARAAETMPLQGVFFVSTYPLLLRNQHWTHKQLEGQLPRRVVFASRYAQGVYNACRALLLGEGASADRCENPRYRISAGLDEPLLEYASPYKTSSQPPLWLMVTGRGGYWPVDLLSVEGRQDSQLLNLRAPQATDEARAHPESPPRAWYLLVCLTSGAGILFSLVVLSSRRGSNDLHAWRSRLGLYSEPEEGRAGRACIVGILALALFALHLTVSWPLAWIFDLPWYRTRNLAFGLATISGSLLLLSVAKAAQVVRTEWAASEDRRRYSILLGIAVFFVLVYGSLFCLAAACSEPTRYFLVYRSLNIASGVSPTLPLVLLWSTVVYGSWVHLRRLVFSYELDPGLPELGEHSLCPYLPVLTRKMQDATRRPLYDVRETFTATILVVVLALTCSIFKTLQSLEPEPFNWLVTMLGCLVFLLITLCWIRAIYIWRTLKVLLEQIERHPIRLAFSRLPRHQAWSPLSQPGVSKRTHNLIARSLDTLRALRHATPDQNLQNRLQIVTNEAARHLQNVLQAVARGIQEPWADVESLRDCYKKTADLLCLRLQLERWILGTSQSLQAAQERKDSEDEKQRPTLLQEEFVALRVVAYLRYVLRQLRNLMGFVVAGFVLLVFALHSYSFQSERLINHVTVGMFLVLGTGIVMVLAQLERDALLSRITDTQAGKLDKSFYLRVVSYGALPALTVSASQFPAFGRFLYSWIQPALEALR